MNNRGVAILMAIFLCASSFAQKEKEIVVFIASRNNIQFCEKNLSSVLGQNYENFRVIYVDDASDDGTGEFVESFCAAHPRGERVTIIHNAERRGSLANRYDAIHNFCEGHEIIVIVDGDDWLADQDVLAYINNIYQTHDVWLTYGQYAFRPGGIGQERPLPDHIVKQNAFRRFQFIPSHLRTYYAWLFKRIKKEDLMHAGAFIPMATDLATMLPMIEMARDHFMFISKVLYIYNEQNPNNCHKVDRPLQYEMEMLLRGKPPYEPLEMCGVAAA